MRKLNAALTTDTFTDTDADADWDADTMSMGWANALMCVHFNLYKRRKGEREQ